MTGAIVYGFVAVLCAVAIFAALLSGRRPEKGFVAWVQDSFAAWRADELKKDKLPQTKVQDADLEDLFSLGVPDDRPAYTRPEEIVARWDDVRERARQLTKH
ncbi:hypothetical protein [Georgenia alba]|uniref:Uncharacterized protein n=1 Tax=Georgenia alba TaxID=2233858 RepID=A0ABW2Q844_9MICO